MPNYEIGMDGRCIQYQYIGLDGNPIERTPQTNPYRYDEFVLFKSENYDKMDSWVYSDRMLQWIVRHLKMLFIKSGQQNLEAKCFITESQRI